MLTSGLTNTPITKYLLIYTVAASVALAIFDVKHLTSIHVVPHLWQYGQYWRVLVWQVAGFANSTEALFAAMLVYHLRVVERAWGKRKLATFLLTTLPYTTLLPPLLLLFLRPLTLTKYNYLPSGLTPTIFALLAQYHASIPHTFRYRLSTSLAKPSPSSTTTTSSNTTTTTTSSTTDPSHSPPTPSSSSSSSSLTLLLSDKSTTYLLATQLALSQFPNSILPALVGWLIGLAWRMELLPGLSPGVNGWRVPAWMVGERETRRVSGGTADGERYRDLRRRLEGEAAAAANAASASGSGVQGQGQGLDIGQRLRRAVVD